MCNKQKLNFIDFKTTSRPGLQLIIQDMVKPCRNTEKPLSNKQKKYNRQKKKYREGTLKKN